MRQPQRSVDFVVELAMTRADYYRARPDGRPPAPPKPVRTPRQTAVDMIATVAAAYDTTPTGIAAAAHKSTLAPVRAATAYAIHDATRGRTWPLVAELIGLKNPKYSAQHVRKHHPNVVADVASVLEYGDKEVLAL